MFSLKNLAKVLNSVLKVPVASTNSRFIGISCSEHSLKMPKKCGSSKAVSSKIAAVKEPPASSVPSSPFFVGKDGDICICIQVKPGAKTDAITDISDTSVGVQISAPPVDGEANTAIVKYFAQLLKLKKTDVSLKGGKSRQKTISVSCDTGMTVEKISAMLQTELQQR